jgi:hypothetical protein
MEFSDTLRREADLKSSQQKDEERTLKMKIWRTEMESELNIHYQERPF